MLILHSLSVYIDRENQSINYLASFHYPSSSQYFPPVNQSALHNAYLASNRAVIHQQ
jgi:hypothetical protein